jgi:hypothetical protein
MDYVARLTALRQRGRRRGVWHRVLTGLERAQVNLTLQLVTHVRSGLLKRVLDSIISKLSEALVSPVATFVRCVGVTHAERLGRLAQRWGHQAAGAWAQDSAFARFLAVMHLNEPTQRSRGRWSA